MLRADGVPTYNFGVVVDDIDMDITHVIRGDDHVNNTPRQINMYQRARRVAAEVRARADDPRARRRAAVEAPRRGERDAVREDGYLPEALVNYLARLGWSHGDEEMFSREQLVEWFDLEHVSKSPARFDPRKAAVAEPAVPEGGRRRAPRGAGTRVISRPTAATCRADRRWHAVVALLKERASTMQELADAAVYFYRALEPPGRAASSSTTRPQITPALIDLQQRSPTSNGRAQQSATRSRPSSPSTS